MMRPLVREGLVQSVRGAGGVTASVAGPTASWGRQVVAPAFFSNVFRVID
ncbi:MAG: hypothetical protein IH905_16160 [Proteobacteria bacterium]|nr:hypothetical protein [Pseudomonadota bacterium]